MKIGHAGFALVAKRIRPAVPLALLAVAAYGPDIIDGVLYLLGRVDREISHSLISVAVGATVIAVGYFAWRRDARDAAAIWLTYVVHWPADFITGHKPTWPGGPTVGLDLYDRPRLSWTIEIAVVAVCLVIYGTARRAGSSIVTKGRYIS